MAVFRAALKFTKVITVVEPKESLDSHLPQIMEMLKRSHDSKMLVRKILERLARVIPAERLVEVFPKEHLPLLQYIIKQVARQQRPKAVQDSGGQDDDQKMETSHNADNSNAVRKRRRGDNADDDDDRGPATNTAELHNGKEPATSAAMAHESVQALLDAWEAESGSEPGDDNIRGGNVNDDD